MAVEGQRDAKNAALIPSGRTLIDSKLGFDLFRGSASLELYRGSFLQKYITKALDIISNIQKV
ncbi:hypothetical protein C4D60_Mb03t15630 [Musa balbisiana]|uniref:Uncharacterized protein n=1 Tax=Musa balbisiana TaxID=52838 RepID=A0A4S8JA79_MUSBA|nr:hypothetical protein C4D60_Mb03t15630 [Musa balbisiana]